MRAHRPAPSASSIAEQPEPALTTSTSASRSTPARLPEQQRLAHDGRVDGRDRVVDELHHLAVSERARRARSAPPSPRTAAARARSRPRSPPAMIVSVPSSAFGEEPVTGASMKREPALGQRRADPRARRPARSWTCRCTSRPLARAAPRDAVRAEQDGLDLRPVDHHRDDDVARRRAAPPGSSATVAPCSLGPLLARSRAVRFQTVSSNPAARRLAAIREPMIPSPMNPTLPAMPASCQ